MMSEGFNTVSLAEWLDVCEDAGVSYVPAEEVAEISVATLIDFDSGDPRIEADLTTFFDTVYDAQRANHIMRWDHCASTCLKGRMSAGWHRWHREIDRWFTIDDPRAYDLLSDYGKPTMVVHRRPWIDAWIIDSYPVEYRVFVADDRVIGVSNYYPQRALPDDTLIKLDIQEVWERTERLINQIPRPMTNQRQNRETQDPHHVYASVDWLRTNDGRLLFLEGGPPHTANWGAHPCCFPPCEIKGVALSRMVGAELA